MSSTVWSREVTVVVYIVTIVTEVHKIQTITQLSIKMSVETFMWGRGEWVVRCLKFNPWRITAKEFLCSKLDDLWKSVRQFVLLIGATRRRRCECSNGGMILTGEKTNHSEKNISQCHLVYDKSHIVWSEIEEVPLRWKAGEWSLEPWCVHSRLNISELHL